MSCNPAHGGSTPDVEDLQLGRLLAAEGRLLQAADAFASALEARPTNRSAAFHLGAALLVSGSTPGRWRCSSAPTAAPR